MRIPVTAVIAVFHQAGIPYPTGSLFDQFIIYEIVKQLPCLLVHRKLNNYPIHWPNFPIAQVQKPQRSPLRLRFCACTLEKLFSVIVQLFNLRCTSKQGSCLTIS